MKLLLQNSTINFFNENKKNLELENLLIIALYFD